MPLPFNSTDWYWLIQTNPSMVYSSKRNIYVNPATDVSHGNWVTATGMSPYPAATESDVWYYLQNWMATWLWDGAMMSQPAVGQYYKNQLNNYNALSRFNKVNAGMIAAGVPVKTDDYSRGLIQGGMAAAQADPTFTTQWYGSDGHFYPLNAAQMIALAETVGSHTNSCYTVFADQANKILTNVTTQPSQIDTAYAGL